jgi:prepilin-type N-terminal cleavage/methylation domain-containing protein
LATYLISRREGMRERGFSLIELIVSMSLVFFLLAATAHLVTLSCAAKRRADFLFTAAGYACSKLEYLKSLAFESPELEPGGHSESVKDDDSAEIFCTEWRVENLAENMKKVVLKIFSPKDARKEAAFVLLMCRELEF